MYFQSSKFAITSTLFLASITACGTVPADQAVSSSAPIHEQTSVQAIAPTTTTQTMQSPAGSQPATYQSRVLPTPKPFSSMLADHRPPPAYLMIDNEAIEATYGHFTTTAHLDPAPDLTRTNDVVTSQFAQRQITIVVDSSAITEFQATLRPWDNDPLPYFDPHAEHLLKVEPKRDEAITAFTLEPVSEASKQLLRLSIKFPVKGGAAVGGSGEANYFWWLDLGNTSQTTTTTTITPTSYQGIPSKAGRENSHLGSPGP